MFFIIYEWLQEKNSLMIPIKIWSLSKHHLWSTKEFKGYGKMMNPYFEWNKKKMKEKVSFIFFTSIAAQQYSLWLKIDATSHKFLRVSCIWFWSLGSHKSNALNCSQIGVEMREIWLFKARLHKRYAVMGLHMV